MKKLLISTISNPYFLVMCFFLQLSYMAGKEDGIELGAIRGMRVYSQIMDDVFKRSKGGEENGSISEDSKK